MESANSHDTCRKSLGTRLYEKHDIRPREILNSEVPRLRTGSSRFVRESSVESSRGKRSPWLEAEVNEFYRGVQIYGVGNWGRIRDAMKTTRSGVHLKDKWRTILKSGEINRLRKEFGPVKK
jgi:hypothetical protein